MTRGGSIQKTALSGEKLWREEDAPFGEWAHAGKKTERESGLCRAREQQKPFLQSLTHAPPKKSHLLRKPHLTTPMEEVPSNEESCKSFSKMNRGNTKYVRNYCNRTNPSADQNLLPPNDHEAEISVNITLKTESNIIEQVF